MRLVQNEALLALANLEEESICSLITDPPAGISFMNKEWDKPTDFIQTMTAIYKECLRVLKPGAHGLVWAIPRTSHWTATALEHAGFEIRDVITHIFGSGFPKSLDVSKAIDKMHGADLSAITAPSTTEAKQWQGWGAALKPASEHWVLVRKPLGESTVAKNVLKHGTGALNIDESRIDHNGRRSPLGADGVIHRTTGSTYAKATSGESFDITQGRFPANLVLSHNYDCEEQCTEGCAVAMLDEQSGISCYTGGNTGEHGKNSSGHYVGLDSSQKIGFGDKGGASRFFYCAKASKKDRGECNIHPTVKSTKLMEYLIRLITPPNGTVLDPFMGSGSTGVAAKRLGFGFVGIEREEKYYKIAAGRI